MPYETLTMRQRQKRVVVIGAGMAGLSCAEVLKAAGVDVLLLDKGRGAGGRMSSRRLETPLGEVTLDHGAQYFTARDPRFCRQAEDWQRRGVVARWPLAGEDAWVGIPAMNAVIRDMAASSNVRWNTLAERLERGRFGWWVHARDVSFALFDAVVIAVPPEQVLPFLALHEFDMARQAMLARSQPCWTAMFVFDAPLAGAPSVLRDSGEIGWAVRNRARPGRSGPESWVVQARPEWSAMHLEREAVEVAPMLLAELSRETGCALPVPVAAVAHRWRYAMSAGIGAGALWNPQQGLGVCGDWLLGPRVECAWLSGRQLGEAILAQPPVRAGVALSQPAE